MPDLSRRSTQPELMDSEATDYETFRACLVDLAKVNRLTLAYRPTLGFFERLHREGHIPADRPLAVLDVGSGYGDMLWKVQQWAHARGVRVELTGADLNPWSARAARQAWGCGSRIRWETVDAFALAPDRPVDVVISSLFTHHLSDEEVVRFLSWMERRATIGWFVNDLHRLAFPYYGFAALAQVMRWHQFVRHDGPVSIARSFRPHDWHGLLAQAGVDGARVERRFPFRLCVSRIRT